MGLKDRKLSQVINQIIQEELQKGNLPSSKEFLWSLSHYLKDNRPGQPEYDFKGVKDGRIAESTLVNEAFNKSYNDFESLYINTIDLYNVVSKNLSQFDVEKSKLEYQINALENQLKDMILLYGKSGFLNSVYDVFDDMNKVNTGKTDAHVDIKKNEVVISDVKNTSVRIIPEANVSFQISPEIVKNINTSNIIGSPSDIVTDHVNEVWQQLVTSQYNEQVAGYLYISFSQKQMMNRIVMTLSSVKSTFVRVEFSPDNLNWFTLPYHEEGVDLLTDGTFDFPSIEIYQLRILLSKTEADKESVKQTNTSARFQYVFGLKTLEFYQLKFAESGHLESLPLQIDVPANQNFSINKVSLLVEEDLPNGTNIDYQIALPTTTGDEPEWKNLSPVNRTNPKYDQIIDFKNITHAPPENFSIDPSISIGEYELEQLYTNGIKFYKIGEIEGAGIITGSEQLFVGKDTWSVKSFQEQFTDHIKHVPSLDEWQTLRSNIQHTYTSIKNGKPGLLLNKETHTEATSYMFTLGVFSEKAKEIVSATPISTEPIAIYMNGEKLFEGVPTSSDKINYLFINGWNEIIVLCYTRDVDAANGTTLDLGFDPRVYGANIYSQAKPMNKVSLFDLRYNIKNNDRSNYAIQDIGTGYYIILNYAVSGLIYDFYFHKIEGNIKDQILLKANFSRNRQVTDISPKLKSYHLRFN